MKRVSLRCWRLAVTGGFGNGAGFVVPVLEGEASQFQQTMKMNSAKIAKVYRLLGWEYKKPERVPPACPYKPLANKSDQITGEAQRESEQHKSTLDDGKQD
ncbi:hypothetical protein KSP39_PZI013027 [Platanthera zijinensis]|uniref:Uncharacterized protein n=1 Tax=Platanthera zijinensis TaxID=2320716 RepID=A0AAP0BDZ1_9ASPA